MRRGIFVVLALLGASFSAPATAAPPRGIVYEVVRHPSAPVEAEVTVHRLEGQGESVSMQALLAPRADGGYQWRSYSGSWSSGGSGWTRQTVELPRGHRFIAGGVRGRLKVTVGTKGWSVREIGSGFRLLAAHAERTLNVAGMDVQRHGRVTAPAGPYGSLAWALVDCEPGLGDWSIATDVEGERRSHRCDPVTGTTSDVEETATGRRWTVEGEAYGLFGWDTKIAVLDYPKPPRA